MLARRTNVVGTSTVPASTGSCRICRSSAWTQRPSGARWPIEVHLAPHRDAPDRPAILRGPAKVKHLAGVEAAAAASINGRRPEEVAARLRTA